MSTGCAEVGQHRSLPCWLRSWRLWHSGVCSLKIVVCWPELGVPLTVRLQPASVMLGLVTGAPPEVHTTLPPLSLIWSWPALVKASVAAEVPRRGAAAPMPQVVLVG